jgi:hypothetical protein
MLLKVDLYQVQQKFAKRQLMKFVSDSERFITPRAFIVFQLWRNTKCIM